MLRNNIQRTELAKIASAILFYIYIFAIANSNCTFRKFPKTNELKNTHTQVKLYLFANRGHSIHLVSDNLKTDHEKIRASRKRNKIKILCISPIESSPKEKAHEERGLVLKIDFRLIIDY